MKNAFLFDMDGVIVNSESKWEKGGKAFMEELYGKDIVSQMGETRGMTLEPQYNFAKSHGFTMPLDEFYRRYDEHVAEMYRETVITPGLEELIDFLKLKGFVVGIVSSSRRPWVESVLQKIERTDLFDYILSLNEKGIASKPNPAGFLHAMKEIGSSPKTTIVLEDSNAGLASAKASGAFTIAFTGLLVEGYKQDTVLADATAYSMEDVLSVIKRYLIR